MKMDKYIIEERIVPYLEMLDDISLSTVAYMSLNRICRNNIYGDVAHPCSNSCFIKRTIGCKEFFNMKDLFIKELKARSKNE